MTEVLVGGLAALAWWLAIPPVTRVRSSDGRPETVRGPGSPGSRGQSEGIRGRWALSALGGLGAWAFLTGPLGLVAGPVTAVGLWVWLGRLESPASRLRRLRLRAELPHVVGLLASAVRGGLPPAEGLALVCRALPGPAADALSGLPDRVALGVPPAEVWRALDGDPALAPLGRALSRSERTGEPVAAALDRLGDELAARARSEVEDVARRVGVRAAVPLGLCLLPSFLLLGIVPVVAGLASSITE